MDNHYSSKTPLIIALALSCAVVGSLVGSSIIAPVIETQTIIKACQNFYGDSYDGEAQCVSDLKRSIESEREANNY
jgi:hypothetical protein